MDPRALRDVILYLAGLVRQLLPKVGYWWKLPTALMVFYQFQQREVLHKNNLFDTYPRDINRVSLKKYCQDPVIGLISLGCCPHNGADWHRLPGQQYSAKDCVATCKSLNYTLAGHARNQECRCSSAALSGCKSKNRNVKRPCRSDSMLKVFRTMHCSGRMKLARSPDGTCNNLEHPAMGSRLYRFGRNVPLNYTFESADLLVPNPTDISRKLLRREEFIPVKQLNLLAVGFIQFVLHDWFDHGTNRRRRIKVPLAADHPERQFRSHIEIPRTRPDKCRQDPAKPRTFQNQVTHWWDASQIYGSDEETGQRLRSFKGGKLKMGPDNLLPVNKKTGIDITGFSQNWWVGLSLLHNIFAREHNNICDMLKSKYPDWSDDKLYDTARLINAAVIIKIQALEWTPAILNNTALNAGVRVNFGLSPGAEVLEWLQKHNISAGEELLKPVVGRPSEFHGVPFSLTEEFVSVYRMHSLMPDELYMRSAQTYARNGKNYSLPEYSFNHARKILHGGSINDVVYTFGTEHPGALTLNNFPRHLMSLKLPRHQQRGKTIDLATIDIIRDRERGIPRYNQMRRLLNLKPLESFDQLTPNKQHVAALRDVYSDNVEMLDLLVGSLAEQPRPDGFGFGETPFVLFVLMATRRLATDRFMTDDYTEDIYSPEGMAWLREATMSKVLIRSFPEMPQLSSILGENGNAFFPWD